jgi:DNA-binding NarL/FixJ family response regulator
MIAAPQPLQSRSIPVALIEDSRLVREGLTALLNRFEDMHVVYGHASDATAPTPSVHPQVVLLDIGLRRGDSLRLAARVRRELPESKVIVMDQLPVQDDVVEFVNVGVAGFLTKDATVDDLVNTIRLVARGANVLPPAMVSTLFSQIARESIVRSPSAPLEAVRMTPREREVINLIAEGLSNKEIAMRLHIANHTVKSHVRNVMEKLTLHTRLQIAAFAFSERTP